jgi:hypothetical protein
MSLNFVANPYSYYNNRNKTGPLYNGKIYVGEPDLDPTIPANKKQVTAKQEDGTQVPIAQPISTNSGGYAVDSAGNPVVLLVDGNYSIRVNDKNGDLALEQSNVESGVPITIEDKPVLTVDTIAELRDFKPEFEGQKISLLGHTLVGIGGGEFYFDESDTTSEDNNGTIIVTAGGKRWKRSIADFISAEMFGAIPKTSNGDETAGATNSVAINASILACPQGFTHSLVNDTVVSNTIVVNRGYLTLDWTGILKASDGFSDDFLVTNTFETEVEFFRWPLQITKMILDCRQKTRGFYSLSMDHVNWNGLRVENSFGNGIRIDRMRESELQFPNVINGLHREAFSNPSDWIAGTAYTPGEYARVKDADWSNVTAYSSDDIVRDGDNRFIALGDTTNEQPSATPLAWKQIPQEDYLCLVANTGKDPQSNNTNSSLEADRVWQKAYQDEACIEIHDVILTGDRSNQITLFSPIVRDCGNKCYVRVDSSKLPARPVTHFNIVCGHIHGQPIAQAGGPIPIPDLQRMIELGYVINTNILNSNIRCGDGDKCIGVMVGDGGTTKVSQDTRLKGVVVSGDGDDDIGLLVMPSNQASTSAEADINYLITAATSTEQHDPRRTFRRTLTQEQRCILPEDLDSIPGGFIVEGSPNYSTVRPYSYRETGDPQPRIDWNITGSSSEIRFGNGANSPDAILRRNATGRLSTNAEFRLEGGEWDDGPLILGVYRLWVDGSGNLRIKNGVPSSDTDGVVVGTQS